MDKYLSKAINILALVVLIVALSNIVFGYGYKAGALETTVQCLNGKLIHGNRIFKCEAYITYGSEG